MTTCANPHHDHFAEPGDEVPDGSGGVTTLTARAPMVCHDCAKPLHYDTALDRYVHDDPEATCFLVPERPDGATPCTTPVLTLPTDVAVVPTCPRCGSDDLGVFAASEDREDMPDLFECERCGFSGVTSEYAEHEVAEAMARGEEHVARERYGDEAVDAAIRATLAAEGYDLDACVEHANGFGS